MFGDDWMELLNPTILRNVKAKRRIEQCPLSNDPPVKRGSIGSIEWMDDDYVMVDFGDEFGTVLCDFDDIKLV